MRRTALFAAALALALSLTACGTMDSGTAGSGMDGTVGDSGIDRSGRDRSSGTLGGAVADGARDAVRDVERGVDDLLDTTPRTTTGANTTSFQRMLDNARVHAGVGVLTAGDNRRRGGGAEGPGAVRPDLFAAGPAGLAYFREAWHNEEKTAGTAQPVWYSGYADVMKFRVDLTVRSFFDQIVQRSCIERHASIFPGSKTNH